MKMTLLIQHIKGDIRSHMLMTYNLPTADFDDSCTKVEDYYRNVYIDDSSGQIGLLKNKPKWQQWRDKKKWWQYGSGKGKYDYDKGKGGKDKGGKDSKGKGKGKKCKGRGKSKGKGKGYYNNYDSG
eukprot:6274336-Amphidinium_carterae.1